MTDLERLAAEPDQALATLAKVREFATILDYWINHPEAAPTEEER